VVERLNVNWGKVVDAKVIREKLEQDRYKAVILVHVETSTAAANPIKEVGEVVKDFDTLFLLDAVSSLAGMEVRMDDWHIDICVTGSQKALGLPVGLALLAASPKALRVVEQRKTPVSFYYGDLKNWLPAMRDPSKFFATPAVNMIYALHESLQMILQEGLENRFRRHQIIADAVRTSARTLGLGMVVDEAHAANTVTAILYPEGMDDVKFRGIMETKFGVTVGGGLGQLEGRIFRIGHMGYVTRNDIIATMAAVEGTLAELNYPFEYGVGAWSASTVLRKL
jgi:aspartate aminotransferase-like enzyme